MMEGMFWLEGEGRAVSRLVIARSQRVARMRAR